MVLAGLPTISSGFNSHIKGEDISRTNEASLLINELEGDRVYNQTTTPLSCWASAFPGPYKIISYILVGGATLGLVGITSLLLSDAKKNIHETAKALGKPNTPECNEGLAVTGGYGVKTGAEFTVLGLVESSLQYGDVVGAVELTFNNVLTDPHSWRFYKRLRNFVTHYDERHKRALKDKPLTRNDEKDMAWIASSLKDPNNRKMVMALFNYDNHHGFDMGTKRGLDGKREAFHRMGGRHNDAKTFATPKSKTFDNPGALATFWSLLSKNNANGRVD